MDEVKIRIITSERGWGRRGEVLTVTQTRADRWCARGIAELVREAPTPKEKKAEVKEPKKA